MRLEAERRLKAGEIKVLVATASLQLGIDIGFVDLVCQIESPRAIAVALQRIGRAGHWRGAIPKGRLFATTREQLAEWLRSCAPSSMANWTASSSPSPRWTSSRSRSWPSGRCRNHLPAGGVAGQPRNR